MIDIHCHILPGLDDGAENMEETLAMCRLAAEEGVTEIFATPHLFQGMFATDRESILAAYEEARERIATEGIPLKLHVGSDLHLVPDLLERLDQGQGVTLNHGKYFLLELPSRVLPPNLDEMVFELTGRGYVPIITHPERNEAILRNEAVFLNLLAKGALCQITAMSVTGEFGRDCEWLSRALIEAEAVHFIASDAHSTGWRNPSLLPALKVAEELAGKEKSRKLVVDHPEAVLAGGTIERADVDRLPKRKRFWIF
jgi:protein-tyrosine phosphatase